MSEQDGYNSPGAEHEAKCRRCGQCCFEKIIIGDEVILTPVPCKHLDITSCECRVYNRRHELQLRCLSVEDGIAARAFPADCPYVADRKDYRPPIANDNLEESDWFLYYEEDEDNDCE